MGDKPVVWLGSSREDIRQFPRKVRGIAGTELQSVQRGEDPKDFKPMPTKRKPKRPHSTTSKLAAGATRRSSNNVKSPSKKDDTKITPGSGNVFLDLGFPLAEAENLRIRADLLIDLRHVIREKAWTQTQAAEFFHETQPRISCIMTGEVTRFSIDKLINLLAKAGLQVRVAVKKTA